MPRALIVAYNFPPNAAIGTMRTLRLIERLAADNWDVRVLTAAPSSYPPGEPVDLALLPRVPASVQVIPVAVLRPYAAAVRAIRHLRPRSSAAAASGPAATSGTPSSPRRSLSRRLVDYVDAATSIPDADAGWIAPVVARGLRTTSRWNPDVIYSTAPPWSAQVATYLLSIARRGPWVADFRDPWARAPWREGTPRLASWARTTFERRVVHRASAVVFNTRRAQQEFATHYGDAIAAKFHLVANGCDVPEASTSAVPRAGNPFVLLHAGSLYGQRSPVVVMEAMASAIADGSVARDRIRLRLLGVAGEATRLAADARRLGLSDVVELMPRVSRGESLREMSAASALLLLQQGHALSVPAKTYEYLAASRPILAIADDGATADVVRDSGAGEVVAGHSRDDVEQALMRVMARAASGATSVPQAYYDGSQRAGELAAILASVARGNAAKTEETPAAAPVRRRRAS